LFIFLKKKKEILKSKSEKKKTEKKKKNDVLTKEFVEDHANGDVRLDCFVVSNVGAVIEHFVQSLQKRRNGRSGNHAKDGHVFQ
jgi:hypothetical protein